MTDLLKRFSAAAATVTSNAKPVRACVYGAYREHLKDINPSELPENIQIIYESVRDRLASVRPKGDLGEDEAGHLAVDILHMADVVKTTYTNRSSDHAAKKISNRSGVVK